MNKWDERYSRVEDAFGKGVNSFLKSQLDDHHLAQYKTNSDVRPKVLCVAAGQGRNALYLARQGFDVTALDISSIGLQQLSEVAIEQGLSIQTICSDITTLDLDESTWDIITCFFMHAPLETRLELYKKVPDALKPSGHFILESFALKQLELKAQNEGSIGGPSTPELFPTVDELSNQFGVLNIEHLLETERELEPSPFHKGNAAVIQLIAKK